MFFSKNENMISFSFLKLFLSLIVNNQLLIKSGHSKKPNLIYILLWTHKYMVPFGSSNPKRKSFTVMNCDFQNCYLTEDGSYFDDITDYDAILFNVIDLREDMHIPEIRSDNQIYMLVSVESPRNFAVETERFNWYFNYTWTYKLNSDLTYPYLIARDKNGEVVAPKKDVHWMDTKDMKPTSQAIKDRLKNKKTAVAWFASNCDADNDRFNYVRNLREALTSYNLEIDIYGYCGNSYCPKDQMDDCLAMVENDYYFYLSFENADSDDYVTEKLMTPLEHFAVPMVLGGANYTRFMPDGIYLNAKTTGEEGMARKMNDLIKDKDKYYDFFKWHRYYSYHYVSESADTDRLCALCAFLNNVTIRSQRRVYARLSEWWNENKVTDDTIFWYENAQPNVKSFYRRYPNKHVPDTPSVLQNVGQFVDQVYNYYFETN